MHPLRQDAKTACGGLRPRKTVLGDFRMMTRLMGGVAAVAVAFLAAPAFGQTVPPAQASNAVVTAQATTAASDDARPARRSRAKAEKKSNDGKPTAGQTAARERQKACAAEWKTAKAAG